MGKVDREGKGGINDGRVEMRVHSSETLNPASSP